MFIQNPFSSNSDEINNINDINKLLKKSNKITDPKSLSNKNIIDFLKGMDLFKNVDERNLKIALKYAEENTDIYRMSDVIKWAKSNIDKNKHTGACILCNQCLDYYKLDLCFLDKDNNPITNGEGKFLTVYAKSLDETLKENFSRSNLIIIK